LQTGATNSINGVTPVEQWDVPMWVAARVEAARKNLLGSEGVRESGKGGETCFRIPSGMNESAVRIALNDAGAHAYFSGASGNRSFTITAIKPVNALQRGEETAD
jgi:hypothetical protein